MLANQALLQEATTKLLDIFERGEKEGTFTMRGVVDFQKHFPGVVVQTTKIGQNTYICYVKL